MCLPLLDNDESDSYSYEIHVYTANKKNAGTDSRVYFILRGETGDTCVRCLEDGKRRVGVHCAWIICSYSGLLSNIQ